MLFAFLGTTEVLIILAIALLVFGPAKLPEIGRQIAMAMREMRKMSNDVQRAFDLDDYRYDRRHDPPAYNTESSTWSPDGYGESAAYTDDTPGAASDTEQHSLPGTRPWSVQDGDLPAAVTTVEPPGPPRKQEEL